MKYFITEKTELGAVEHGPLTANNAILFVDNIDLPESKLKIVDEDGEELDSSVLRIRAEKIGPSHA